MCVGMHACAACCAGARSPTPMALAFYDDDVEDEFLVGNTGLNMSRGADGSS